MSDAAIVVIVLGYVLDALLWFSVGYLLGRRRRPPRRIRTHVRHRRR